MKIIIVLIVCSLILAIGFLIAFIWSVKSGQMDDTTTPGMRILNNEDKVEIEEKDTSSGL